MNRRSIVLLTTLCVAASAVHAQNRPSGNAGGSRPEADESLHPHGPAIAFVPSIGFGAPLGRFSALRASLGIGYEPLASLGLELHLSYLGLMPGNDPIHRYLHMIGPSARFTWHVDGRNGDWRPAISLVGAITWCVADCSGREAPWTEFGIGLESRVVGSQYFDVRPRVTLSRLFSTEQAGTTAWLASFEMAFGIGGSAIRPSPADSPTEAMRRLLRHIEMDLADLRAVHGFLTSRSQTDPPRLVPAPTRNLDIHAVALTPDYAPLSSWPIPQNDLEIGRTPLNLHTVADNTCAVFIAQSVRVDGLAENIDLRVRASGTTLALDEATDDWPVAIVCNALGSDRDVTVEGRALSATANRSIPAAIARLDVDMTLLQASARLPGDYPVIGVSNLHECGTNGLPRDGGSCLAIVAPGSLGSLGQMVVDVPGGGRLCAWAPDVVTASVRIQRISGIGPSETISNFTTLSGLRFDSGSCATLPSTTTEQSRYRATAFGNAESLTAPVVIAYESEPQSTARAVAASKDLARRRFAASPQRIDVAVGNINIGSSGRTSSIPVPPSIRGFSVIHWALTQVLPRHQATVRVQLPSGAVPIGTATTEPPCILAPDAPITGAFTLPRQPPALQDRISVEVSTAEATRGEQRDNIAIAVWWDLPSWVRVGPSRTPITWAPSLTGPLPNCPGHLDAHASQPTGCLATGSIAVAQGTELCLAAASPGATVRANSQPITAVWRVGERPKRCWRAPSRTVLQFAGEFLVVSPSR